MQFDLKARYLPALSGAIETTGFERKCRYTGKPLTFWEPESLVQYPYMLMSAWYGLKVGQGPEWRDSRRTTKGSVFVLGDSGGFQAVTQGEKLDSEKFNARKVIEWQNNNVDVGLILDVPPFKAQKRIQKGIASASHLAVDNRTKAQIAAFGTEFDFDGCLKKTVDNASVMNKHKANQWLYGVIQGTTDEKMVRWHKAVAKTGDFDGWALAPKPNDDYGLIYRMMKYAYEKLHAPLHFLQLGGPMATVMIERFSKIYDFPITYDNSTPFKLGGVFRIFQSFTDGRNISIGTQTLHEAIREKVEDSSGWIQYKTKGVDTNRKRMNDPLAKASWEWIGKHVKDDKIVGDCDCGVCKAVKFSDYQASDVEGALYLILHDLYAYAAEQKRSKSIAFDDALIRENITRSSREAHVEGSVIALLNNIDEGFPEKQTRLFG